jgi:hypothetical protein
LVNPEDFSKDKAIPADCHQSTSGFALHPGKTHSGPNKQLSYTYLKNAASLSKQFSKMQSPSLVFLKKRKEMLVRTGHMMVHLMNDSKYTTTTTNKAIVNIT